MCPVDGHGVASTPALGFLTVVDGREDGLFGGYLLLNLLGRPLEFHCTAPIRPNRAQEILFGPTLEPYLYGEQIGQTLLEKAATSAFLVCTDQPAALAVRPFSKSPVVLVLPQGNDHTDPSGDNVGPAVGGRSGNESGSHVRFDGPHGRGESLSEFRLGRNRLAVPARAAADREVATERLAEIAETFDLAEPFGRIRQAIEEARQGGS